MYRRGGLGDCLPSYASGLRTILVKGAWGCAKQNVVIINLACCVCYGMHNEFGESRPVGEVLELPGWIYECHRPPLFGLALYA